MESTEASMLVEQFNNDQILERIRNTPDDIFISNKNLGRAYSWFLELFLIEHSNKHVHNRIQNIMTWVHALGGAITAIFAAFLTLIIIGIPVLLTYFKTPDLCEFLQNFCLTFIWGSIIVMFFYVREDTKCIFHVLWRHFISSNQSKLREFLEEGNK